MAANCASMNAAGVATSCQVARGRRSSTAHVDCSRQPFRGGCSSRDESPRRRRRIVKRSADVTANYAAVQRLSRSALKKCGIVVRSLYREWRQSAVSPIAADGVPPEAAQSSPAPIAGVRRTTSQHLSHTIHAQAPSRYAKDGSATLPPWQGVPDGSHASSRLTQPITHMRVLRHFALSPPFHQRVIT
jgi:hypothetical protein